MSLRIEPVLCRAGTMDNYAYVITDEATQKSAIVDASEAAPIAAYCDEMGIKPEYILTTHHHFDHVGGNEALKEYYNLKVVGPEAERGKISGLDIGLKDGDVFHLGESSARVISAPGHTLGHILWYFEQDKILLTGDVLFNLCIGGIFEGTAEQMWQTLQTIKALPDNVKFYPGHEYTAHCLSSDMGGELNPIILQYFQRARELLAQGLPVAPVSLGVEKQCNPYLLIQNKAEFECFFK